MPTTVTTVVENRGDERRPGFLYGTDAQIAADPKVFEYWPPRRPFVDTAPFAWRPAKNPARGYILRPSETGYRPGIFPHATTGAIFLGFGTGPNGGPAGGSLTNTNNGALQVGSDAPCFPVQDATGAVVTVNPVTIISRLRAPVEAAGDDVYPGAAAGSMCRFPDSPSVNQSDWAGIGIGIGSISENRAILAGRGTLGFAADPSNRANNQWFTLTGIYDPVGGKYRVRINGVQTAETSITQSNGWTQRTGYQLLRVGAAGDLGAAIERTWTGYIGGLAIMHLVGDDALHLTSLQRIENHFTALFPN